MRHFAVISFLVARVCLSRVGSNGFGTLRGVVQNNCDTSCGNFMILVTVPGSSANSYTDAEGAFLLELVPSEEKSQLVLACNNQILMDMETDAVRKNRELDIGVVVLCDGDQDGDGYSPPEDCDDTDASVYPGAVEICDGKDNDCNGVIDYGLFQVFYQDSDGDTYGNAAVSIESCDQPAGYVSSSEDCDDTDASVNPGAAEICDGMDNDCNGVVDDGLLEVYYEDSDGDGYGNAAVSIESCNQPQGYVPSSGDCDDTDASVNPGAVEVCDDGIDNDCDGFIDAADDDCLFE